MCNDNKCHRAGQCYRFTANQSDYQYYFVVSPLQKDNSCNEFWLDERHKILRSKNG